MLPLTGIRKIQKRRDNNIDIFNVTDFPEYERRLKLIQFFFRT